MLTCPTCGSVALVRTGTDTRHEGFRCESCTTFLPNQAVRVIASQGSAAERAERRFTAAVAAMQALLIGENEWCNTPEFVARMAIAQADQILIALEANPMPDPA